MQILTGRFSEKGLASLIREASQINDLSGRIAFISGHFLETPYKAFTLAGDRDNPEVLVINLEGVDCFTFLDYVEAMRLSPSFEEFPDRLKRIRYKSGAVSFENRNHFFTDWKYFNREFVDDVTSLIAEGEEVTVNKMLNLKEDGMELLKGVPVTAREIKYIPADIIHKVFKNLMTGDYAGIYSNSDGLDVSHTGIIIRKDNDIFLRHASSQKQFSRVIDQEFTGYLKDKPGIIILRPKPAN